MGKYKLTFSSKFKKDFKKHQYNPKEVSALMDILGLLTDGGAQAIPDKFKAHKLLGNYKGLWECHVLPDLLLIWDQEDVPFKEIHLIRLGTHSQLFY
ncbi:type II toxin-antitoxin system YafQ family toxin [Sphingobacterium humi]|uniref:Type II toxin-antitoxin system mRNA interferase toxin, RelE/StbE family n=1 Tax=Sphingobacterium humi TaxID=1796905 RepID=A0A6N8L165_9SPHI|nr:type II toxin-antitoxin system YafQ family toxin [Sphingobacterium humi]MVZ62749.1 type II toxin-antitoxin system mRNA interferase toxin, RelE/StbE family [Sphingobacterium humi]